MLKPSDVRKLSNCLLDVSREIATIRTSDKPTAEQRAMLEHLHSMSVAMMREINKMVGIK